jgi:hypothetical protein
MKADDLFRKTYKGQAAIDTRSHGLSLQQRRILILVNGDNDFAALEQLSLCDNLEGILQQLVADGLIESAADDITNTTVMARDYALS